MIPLNPMPLKKSISNIAENNIHHKQRLYMDKPSHRVRQRRRDTGGCINQLVGVLHCYNVFLLILGAGVLGLGIWLLVKDYSTREISAIIDSRLFEYVTYALVAGGGSVAVLAFCGCCGTMRQDKYVLGFYGTVLFMVLVVLVGGSVLGIIFRKKISANLQERFKATLQDQYGIDLIKNSENRLITDAWDAMQRTLECCGAYGDEHSQESWALYKLLSKWYKTLDKQYPYVPESCCVPGMSQNACQGITKQEGIPNYGPDSMGKTVAGNSNLYTTGCLDKAVEYLQKHSLYIAIVAGAVPVFLIAGIVISFYLCVNVKPDEDEDEEEDDGQEAEV